MLISKAQCSAKAPIEMPESEAMRAIDPQNFRSKGGVSSREWIHIPPNGKLGKSSSNMPFLGGYVSFLEVYLLRQIPLFVAKIREFFGRASTAVHSVPHMSFQRKSLNGLLETWQVSVEDTKTILTPSLW